MVALAIGFVTALVKASRWIGKVDSDREAFKTFKQEIRGTLEEILLRLSAVVRVGSSIQLTEYGQTLADSLQASEWASGVAPRLTHEVKDMRAYQIQEHCQSYVTTSLDEEMRESVEELSHKEGLGKDDMIPVLWVILQDRLLEIRKSGDLA